MMDDRTRASRATRGRAQHDRDLYSWAVEQAELLRAGRIAEADAQNIAEELDDVGNEQYKNLRSALRIILLHLLKWDHQPQRRSRSWWASITVQRNEVRRILSKNPGLKSRLDEALNEAYEDARVQAAAQTKLRLRSFPSKCPFRWEEITQRDVSWADEE
jgi:predicted  nucleic acid-binding Zn-ribbon protein